SKPSSSACRAERLARAGTGPDLPVVGPAGESEGMGPDADSGEEMMLAVAVEIGRVNVTDIPFVHVAGRDQPGRDQVPEPLAAERVDLVVVGGHFFTACES